MSSWDFVFGGIGFQDMVVVDAGTGAGNTTLRLARRLEEFGGKRLISVD